VTEDVIPIDVISQPRSATEVLAWSRSLVDPAMRAAVDRLPASMRRVAGYMFIVSPQGAQATKLQQQGILKQG